MKSKLQDGDVCECVDGSKGSVKQVWIKRGIGEPDLSLGFYTEDLTRIDYCRKFDIIRVNRNGKVIWQRDEPIDINKMTTVIHNGQTYPLATHENMKILVDKISELEKEISNLKQGER